MSQYDDLRFHSQDDWTILGEDDVDKGVVELLEKDNATGEYSGRMSTLDCELPMKSGFPDAVVFASTKAIATWVFRQDHNIFPAGFWPVITKNLNGTFGCEYHRDQDGKILTHDSWSCLKVKRIRKTEHSFKVYDNWTQLGIFVRHQWDTSNQLVIFLNCPEELKKGLRALLPSVFKSDPYAWHATFAGEIAKVYEQAIWDLRGVVWEVELYQKKLGSFQPEFILLHDMARHISHSKEVLEVAADALESMIHEQSILDEQYPRIAERVDWHFKQIQQELYFVSKGIRATKFRCISLSERLQNEINLAFNIVSQRNNEVSVQMAQSALTDNTMMKTVAIVSLIYLPGTFVSGIFGMNFFDFNTQDGPGTYTWSMSENFWLYWLVTIPLTLGTMVVWLIWFNRGVIMRVILDWTGSQRARRRGVFDDKSTGC